MKRRDLTASRRQGEYRQRQHLAGSRRYNLWLTIDDQIMARTLVKAGYGPSVADVLRNALIEVAQRYPEALPAPSPPSD